MALGIVFVAGQLLFLPAVMAEKQSKGKQCFAGARKAFCA
jgi:hypothetical protein